MAIDLRTMLLTWVLVTTRPGNDVFEAERLKPSATLTTALLWIVLAGVVTALLELLHAQLYPSPFGSTLPFAGHMSSEFLAAMAVVPGRSPFQILTGIFTAPVIFIISSILSLFPLLNCLSIPILAIYQLVLTYFATRVEYRLNRDRAFVVIVVAKLFVGVGVTFLGGALYGMGGSY